MITLDTSGILAVLNRSDRHHHASQTALQSVPGPWVVPAGIFGEAAYMIETILTTQVLDAFLEDIESGVYVVDWRREDVSRIRYFTTRYASLPLGFADSSVVACAERNGARVLTLDRRSFDVVAREVPLVLLPA